MKKLTITDLDALINRLSVSIENNTTQEVFHMTEEEAEFLKGRLNAELEERMNIVNWALSSLR